MYVRNNNNSERIDSYSALRGGIEMQTGIVEND